MGIDTRSWNPADLQLGLWPGCDGPRPVILYTPRVGGRHGRRRPRRGGGGYLNGRTISEFGADPRLRELAEIGLQAHWLKMAEAVGYDAFVAVWRMFSANLALRDDSNQISLTLRSVRSYDRYQRNRYVETLVASGCTNRQIFDLVRSSLGDWVTWRQIQRITQEIRTRERAKGEPAPVGHQYDLVAACTVAP